MGTDLCCQPKKSSHVKLSCGELSIVTSTSCFLLHYELESGHTNQAEKGLSARVTHHVYITIRRDGRYAYHTSSR